MIIYKHTQIGYQLLVVTAVILAIFIWMYMTAVAEAPSVDSGTNLFVIATMVFIVVILTSFATLTTSLDETYLRVAFGFGIFSKKFLVRDIASVRVVKNSWWYGWGIRFSLCPRMWIFNVSGFDAVEIVMRDKRVYRIGTDVPKDLEMAITRVLSAGSRD